MRNIIFAVSVFIMCMNSYADKMVIGDVDNAYIPNDSDFNKINKATEYLVAKEKLIKAQQSVLKLQSQNTPSSGSIDSMGSSYPAGIPKHMRGKVEGDVYLDSKGNQVVAEKPAQAYLSSVSGLNGNLTAEVFWGDRVLIVSKGDTLIGGSWIVKTVNTDDIMLTNGSEVIRLGVVPVNIDSLVK